MTSHHYRRSAALLVSAALLASLTVATVASPVSAAKPKCQGKVATIVGTNKGDILKGTAKRDIIVARGGNDRIYAKGGNDIICAGGGNDTVYGGPGADRLWGQLGHDKLNGNAGNDFLAGQVGNDRLNGGINYDTCYQGTGTGPVLSCELPAPPPPPPVVQAPVPPPPDSDGDGIPDGSDACPNQGNQGWGVDASGCPKPPPNWYAAQCATDGGAYHEPYLSYTFGCTWARGTSPYASALEAKTVYAPICAAFPNVQFHIAYFDEDTQYVACTLAT